LIYVVVTLSNFWSFKLNERQGKRHNSTINPLKLLKGKIMFRRNKHVLGCYNRKVVVGANTRTFPIRKTKKADAIHATGCGGL
jgi:hypothetical protein